MVKGEIWWADLPETFDTSEPAKRRPVLIIQNDKMNRSGISTVIVAAITRNIKLALMPANITLEKIDSGLPKTSVINFSQIATLDRSRLLGQVSMLPKKYIAMINQSIQYIFDTEGHAQCQSPLLSVWHCRVQAGSQIRPYANDGGFKAGHRYSVFVEILPDTVTHISGAAFWSNQLTSVTAPSGASVYPQALP